jgi:2-methylaconitate cis-trans-isomerase PrpF
VAELLDVPGHGQFNVSMVDAANACCFIRADALGITGTEMPDALDSNTALLERLQAIRIAASVAMGIASTPEEAKTKRVVPFIGFVSDPQDAATLTGEKIGASSVDVTGRMISNGQPHRALPLTASLCMAVAARLEGSVVNAVTRTSSDPDAALRIAMPSGVLTVAATVRRNGAEWHAEQGAFFRTQRRLFDGYVYVRASRITGAKVDKRERIAA